MKHLMKSVYYKLKNRRAQYQRKKLVRKIFRLSEGNKSLSDKRVLCWDPSPFPALSLIIRSIGTALALRGSIIETVLCDGPRNICQGATLDSGITDEAIQRWSERCPTCFIKSKSEAQSFFMKTCALGDLIPSETQVRIRKLSNEIPLDELFSFEYLGVDVGRHTKADVIRHYVNKIDEKDWKEDIIRECFFTALIATEASLRKIDSFQPDAVFMIHAQYAPWGPAYDIAAARGIPVVRVQSGYFPGLSRFRIFADGLQVKPRSLSDSSWEKMKNTPLSEKENEILNDYFKCRYSKGGTDIKVKETSRIDKGEMQKRLGIAPDRPIWCIFPNVGWDAALQLIPKAFKDDRQWLIETITTISTIPEVQWIIKVHPGEHKNKTIYGVQNILAEYFDTLPENLVVIPSNIDINTSDVFDLVDGGVFYIGNTASTELTMMGKPVIMAGETINSKRGFTFDADTPEQYVELLKKTPELKLDKSQILMACRFAYYYFIKTQIPLRFMNIANRYWHSFDWNKLESLLPSRDPFIDLICNNFFGREEIVIPDELIDDAIQVWRQGSL